MRKKQDFSNKQVAIVGIGRNGSRLAELLLKLKINKLRLIDGDVLEKSDCGKQCPLFLKSKTLISKSNEAARILSDKYKQAEISYNTDNLNYINGERLLENCELICDCTDNWLSRNTINFLINKKNSKLKSKYWIYCGALKQIAMVSTLQRGKTPCWQCWNSSKEIDCQSCSVVGYDVKAGDKITKLVSEEVVRILKNKQPKFLFNLIVYNSEFNKLNLMKLESSARCELCKGKDNYFSKRNVQKKEKRISTLCGNNQYQITNGNLALDFNKLEKTIKKNNGKIVDNVAIFDIDKKSQAVVFSNARMLIRSFDSRQAEKINDTLMKIFKRGKGVAPL